MPNKKSKSFSINKSNKLDRAPLSMNSKRILQLLKDRGSMTQAELSRETGLSRSTISNFVAALSASGLIVPADRRALQFPSKPSSPGRPGTTLQLDPNVGAVIGIDFHHRRFQVALVNLAHELIAEGNGDLPIDHSAKEAIDAAVNEVERVLEKGKIQPNSLIGVGIGLPGPIDSKTGYVTPSSVSPGWLGVDVKTEFRERLRLPVAIDNDANLGALAEQIWGAGRGIDNFIYVRIDTGIGAGLVINGQLVHGSSGAAGEIGHVTLDERGPVCRCGNRGCLERYVGESALLELLQPIYGPGLTITKMLALAEEGDLRCRRVLEDAGHILGIGLADVATMVNPARFIIGGILAKAGDLLLNPMRQALTYNTVELVHRDLLVVPGQLGKRAEVMGAVALAMQQESVMTYLVNVAQGKTRVYEALD
jgi:predicted NBD/HSP70 family sugar kinase/biotin operon repressor